MVDWKNILPGGCGGGRIGCLEGRERAVVVTKSGERLILTQNKTDGAQAALVNLQNDENDTLLEALDSRGELRFIYPHIIREVIFHLSVE